SVGLAAQALGSTAAAEKLLASLGYAGATGTLESGTPTDLQPNYTTTGTFSAPGWSDKLDGTTNFYLPGGMRLMGVSGDGLMGPFYPGKLAVTQPTQCYSGHAAETLSLQIPPSVRFSSVPHDVLVKTANITFRAHWSLNKNTLTVHRDFASTVDQPLCTDALRKQTAAALKEISDSYDIELSLVPPPAKASATMSSQNVKGGYKGLGIRPETLKNFNAASAAIQNSDFDNGIRLLTAVLADKSLAADQRYVTYTNRASAYYRAGRFQQAIDDISQAIKLKKDDARAYGIRASLFERTGNQTAALSDFAAYTRLAPNDRGVRVESGNLNFQDANYAAAIKDFSAALAMNGNDSQTLVVRGMAYEKLGDYDHAAADFGRAATMGDIDQNGETRYCAALSRGHKPSLAIPQCEISLRADPYSGDSLQARGYAYFRLGKYKDALKDFTAANHVYPANAEYLYSRGAAKLRLGDKSGGNQDLQAARQISPGVDQKMAAWRLVP
ncbi:MAG TPA: tetratricopeptide repeat protein, partial [Rhizomicrobium sp.]|nr:tetratricopeptide repeat protein [Rhizomicrobium sp.]